MSSSVPDQSPFFKTKLTRLPCRSSVGTAAAVILIGSIAHADYFPLTLAPSSWTQDMVVENGATTFTGALTATMDSGTARNGFSWYEVGMNTGSATTGIPRSGSTFTSAASPTTAFQLQQFNSNNAVLLNSANTNATLTLATPTALTGLTFLTSSGGGSSTVTLTINFSDGTPSLVSAASFVSPDWFGNTPIAVNANGRVQNNGWGGFNFGNVGSDNPRLYEQQVLIPTEALAHPISSINLSIPGGGSAQTAILAVSASTTEKTWSGAVNSNWNINNTQNWVGPAAYADSDTVVFDDTGTNRAINIQTGGAGVRPFAVVFKHTTGTYSFTGDAIAGGGSLTLNGTGSVTLGNINTYTGGTVVNAGTLSVLSGATLGSATGSLAVNNPNTGDGTAVVVNLNSSQTLGSLSGLIATPASGVNTATVNLNGAGTTLTVNQASNTVFDGILAGAGGLVKTGAGTLSLKGLSVYTGGTVINGGVLESFNPGDESKSALPAGQPVTVNAGATLRMGEDDGVGYYADSVSSVTVNGGLVVSKYGHHSTLPNLVLNGGTVTAQGAGNVSNGVTTNYILDGTVTTVAGSAPSTINAPKILLRGNTSGISGDTGPVTFQVPRGTASVDLAVSSSLADKGAGLIKTGNGILSLSGNSTYSGGTTISSGTVAVSGVQGSGIATNALGTGLVSLNGGVLALQGQTAAVEGLTANFYNQPGGVNQANFNDLSTFQSHFATLTPALGPINTTTGGKTDFNFSNGNGASTSPFGVNPPASDTANYGFTGATDYEATFTGYIAIPAAGTYTFGTRSDDGSAVFIDGNHDPVVANNFFQGMGNAKTGTYTFPAAGLYPITVGYNQGGGGQGLQVLIAPPGGNLNTMINAQVFSATSTVAPTQWYSNDVVVGANSTIQVTNSLAASMGTLSIGQNTLNLTGDTGSSLSFHGINLVGNAVLNTAAGTTLKSGAVSDDGAPRSLTKSGAGALSLNALSTYTGGTAVNAGTVTVGHSGALGTGNVTMTGGVLSLSSSGTAGFNNYSLNGNNGILPTLDVANDLLTLTDNGSSQARSAFSQTQVSIANGFTANFVYTAGGDRSADGFAFVIQNNSPTALGGAGGSLGYAGITNSAALEFNLYTGNGNPIGTTLGANGTNGTYIASPSVNFASGNPISVKVVYDNTAKTLTETLTDQISNSTYTRVFTGTDLMAALGGTVGYIGFTGATGGAVSTQTISSFEFNNYSQGIVLTNNIGIAAAATAGVDVLPVSAGGAGTATLQGSLTLNAGSTLNVTGGASATNSNYSLNVTGTTTLAGNTTISVSNNGTGAGIATLGNVGQSSAAGLTKVGNGTLVLSGSASYTGGTAVNAGTLIVSGTLGGSTTGTTVASDATLGGAGTINPAVAVTGTISPGNAFASIGKLTLASANATEALNMSGGGTFLWELGALMDNITGVAGIDFDQIALTGSGGNLKLGGTSKLTIAFDNGIANPNSADPFWASNHSWTIILGAAGVTNTLSTNFSSITDATFAHGFFSTSASANGNVTLNYIAVPEPGTFVTLAGGLGVLLGFRRVRRRDR